MLVCLGLFCVFTLYYSNAETQQLQQESHIVVNNVPLNSQFEYQYKLQHNLITNLGYDDLMKLNKSNDDNIKINNRNDFNDSISTTPTNQIIYEQPPKKQLNSQPEVDHVLVSTESSFNLNDNFDWKFLKHMFLENSSKNVIVSPFSIKLILSLLLEGAGNNTNTQNEILKVLSTTEELEKISQFWNKTIKSFNEPSKYYDFLFGTKIFVDDFIKPTQKYASRVQAIYDVEIDSLSFKNSSKSADIINKWSSDATKGYIKNIVTSDQLESAAMLILNAIYFQGKWKYSFNPNESFVGDFFYEPTKTVRTQYMTKRDYYNYMDSYKLNAKIIQIPYEGNRFHLTLLLPKAKGGLEQLIYDLSPATFKKLTWSADDETEVKLTLPKLRFQYDSSLKDTLRAIGVNEIFNDNASLPLIDRGAGLKTQIKVSDIYQKSGLQIDETGTIAYAETAAIIENKFGGGIEDFTANRPFLFFIQDVKEDKIIFAGKVINPEKL